jgi:hypothetical protein
MKMWRRAIMALSLPAATLAAAFLWWQSSELYAVGAHDNASMIVALSMCITAWALLAIAWIIWNPEA